MTQSNENQLSSDLYRPEDEFCYENEQLPPEMIESLREMQLHLNDAIKSHQSAIAFNKFSDLKQFDDSIEKLFQSLAIAVSLHPEYDLQHHLLNLCCTSADPQFLHNIIKFSLQRLEQLNCYVLDDARNNKRAIVYNLK